MAARDATVSCPAGVWTQITNGAATGDVAVMKRAGGTLLIAATATASAPTGTDAFALISYGDGWSEATIAEKFPGVTGAQHLWGRPEDDNAGPVTVRISHA